MNRRAFLRAAGGAVGVAAFPWAVWATESEMRLSTPTGMIAGTLEAVPATPAPVVLIIPGSGPVDRNGNGGGLHSDTYARLASALAVRGIASVRYDKRGVGASTAAAGAEQDLRFGMYVGDAAAWLRRLRADGRFSAVVVAGHSEGSLVGMIALQHTPADTFVSLEGAGFPAPAVLRAQLGPRLPPSLYAEADAIITRLQQGRLVPDVPPALAVLFRPSVQPYLISWFKYDPAAEIATVRVPATIVQGTADVQVTTADAEALYHANPSARLILVDGMNHVLRYWPDTSSQAAILEGYEDPSLPIDPRAVEAIAAAAR